MASPQSESAIRSPQSAIIDALLLLMALIWGTNYSIVKSAFAEIDPYAFNAARMSIASVVFLLVISAVRRPPVRVGSVFHTPAAITLREWLGLTALGIVGHAFYQYCFIGGLARTSVTNSALIIAATPVVIALFSAVLGQDRVGVLHWIGAVLSMFGIYLIVGRDVDTSGQALVGDLMMGAGVCAWAIYTIEARRLMVRHSPVGVTGLSMAIGTLVYVPVVWSSVRAVPWTHLSARTSLAILYSSLFALCIAYTIWYTAVRQIGSARTSVYSNVVPLVAMATAVIFLGEPLSRAKIAGTVAVLAGVALTRARTL
jgi:drug/metabolite transporter (DMT)-like permease